MTRRLLALARRVSAVFGGGPRDTELAEELRGHLQLHIDDNIRAGMAPDEARRAALIALGGVTQTEEAWRDRRGLPVVETAFRDARHGIRLLRRNPGFAVAAILSLALGIGANVAIFSILDGVLLRPLPVPGADRLVQLQPGQEREVWSNPLWEQVQARPELFESAAAWSGSRFNLADRGEARRVDGLFVSGSFFETFRIAPALGRLLGARDDVRGGGVDGAVAVVSHAFWERELGGRADAIGESIRLERVPFAVVGVMPPDFFGPYVGRRYDVVIPIGTLPLLRGSDAQLDERSSNWLFVMALRRADQSIEALNAALQVASPAIREATLPTNWLPENLPRYLEGGVTAVPAAGGPSGFRRSYERPLVILMGVVVLVLLIASANVANLLAARSAARRSEIALRHALGASRWRVARQLLTESLVLALAGAALGVALAAWGRAALVAALSNATSTVYLDLTPDWRIAAFLTGTVALVCLLFGSAPAWRAGRGINDATSGPARSQRVVAAESRVGAGGLLVVVQVALSLVLVVAAVLFLRTFVALSVIDPGFNREGILTVQMDSRRSPVTPEQRSDLFARVQEAVDALPGVAGASLSVVTPISGDSWSTVIQDPEGMSLPESDREVYVNVVGPGWFDAFGVTRRAGRDFEAQDVAESTHVILVNETFVRRFLPDGSPIGRLINDVGRAAPPREVIGVVSDAMYESLRETVPPTMYRVVTQAPSQAVITLAVTAAEGRDPSVLSPSIADAIAEIDPDLTLSFQPLAAVVEASVGRERLLAMLAAGFGVIGLTLAAIGLYGVLAYNVHRRRMEIGVRMALGASPGGIIRLIVGRLALLVLAGAVVGSGVSWWIASYAESLVFGVDAQGAPVLLQATLVLLVVGAVASVVPARRAARTSPTTALR